MSLDGRLCLTTELKQEPNPLRNKSAKVWDLDAGGKQVAVLSDVRFVRFSPDGKRVLGWGYPGPTTLKVWDAVSGQEALTFSTAYIGYATFSSDGTRLYGSATIREMGKAGRDVVKVLDAITGKELPEIQLPDDRSGTLLSRMVSSRSSVQAVSPDGSRIVVRRATFPETDRIEWFVIDATTGRTLFAADDSQRAIARGGRTLGARFSPDGKLLVFHQFAENSLAVHDATTGRPLHKIRGLGLGLAAFAVTPDSQRLRTVEPDGTLREWGLAPDQPVRIETGGRIDTNFHQGLECSADGEWLAAYFAGGSNGGPGNDTVRAWHTAGKVAKEFKYHPRDPDQNYWSGGVPVLSGDGSRLAFVRSTVVNRRPGVANPAKLDAPGDLTVWDVASGKEVFHADGHFHRYPTAIAPDGRSVVVVRRGADGSAEIVVFDVESGRERRAIPLPQSVGLGMEMRFRPDGKRLAGCSIAFSDDGTRQDYTTLAVWDVADGKRIDSFKTDPFPGLTLSLEWSPDGKRILVCSTLMSRQATVHDAETGRVEATLDTASRGGRIPQGAKPAFSADGRRITCGVETAQGRFVKIWDTATGRELLALRLSERGERGLAMRPQHLAFSPDGNRLLDFAVNTRPNRVPGRAEDVIDVTTWDATPREVAKHP
jgi:WD40 repeat protein